MTHLFLLLTLCSTDATGGCIGEHLTLEWPVTGVTELRQCALAAQAEINFPVDTPLSPKLIDVSCEARDQ